MACPVLPRLLEVVLKILVQLGVARLRLCFFWRSSSAADFLGLGSCPRALKELSLLGGLVGLDLRLRQRRL